MFKGRGSLRGMSRVPRDYPTIEHWIFRKAGVLQALRAWVLHLLSSSPFSVSSRDSPDDPSFSSN